VIGRRPLRQLIADAFRTGEQRTARSYVRAAEAPQARQALSEAEARGAERGAATGHTQPAYRGQRDLFNENIAAGCVEEYYAYVGAQWLSG